MNMDDLCTWNPLNQKSFCQMQVFLLLGTEQSLNIRKNPTNEKLPPYYYSRTIEDFKRLSEDRTESNEFLGTHFVW
jgi:hypothetical protein